MAEKDIVFKIEAVTNQNVIDAYGEVLDKVIGKYDDWIAETKKQDAVIKELNARMREKGDLTNEELKQLNEAKSKRSQYQQLMKQEDKINTSLNGSLKQQQLLLSKVNTALRNMTDEQKKANPELVKFQKNLYDSVKAMNAEMGNFQMNVGNYPQLLQQILPVQSQVGQGLMQLAQNAGASTGAIAALGVGLGAAVGAYKLFQQAQELTQTVGDEVAISVAGWEAVYDKFIRTIVSADFSNFIQGLLDAKDVGEELTAALDELFERNNALRIAEAKASLEQEKNLQTMRDQTKSVKERKEAAEAYIETERNLAKVRQDIAKQEFEARLKNFAAQSGMSEEDVRFYIENYEKYRNAANAYLSDVAKAEADIKEQRKYIRDLEGAAKESDFKEQERRIKQLEEVKNSFGALTAEEQRFITLGKKYNLTNDEITEQLVTSWVDVETAIANGEKRVTRAVTMANGLTAREKVNGKGNGTTSLIDFDKFKAEADKEAALVEDMLDNIIGKMNPKIATAEALKAIDDFVEEMENEAPIIIERAKTKSDKSSPLAKLLGVAPEELEILKSQAMQAAQQIFDSIQQISQQSTQQRLDNELKAVETEAEREKAILKAKLDSGVLNEKQYEKKIAEIDKQAEARREEAQKEAFEREKRWNIAAAFMNMALGVTAALKALPSPKAWIEAALVTTTGLAQVATISAQKFARGGELHGASHAQGGIKGNIQGHNIELEGDEVVINKRSAHKYRNILSYINSDNGWGVDFAGVRGSGGYSPNFRFARGGVLSSFDFSPSATPQSSSVQQAISRQANRVEELIYAINRRIDRLQVMVNISDIENASNTKQVHINRASL